ncbi:MAG: NADH-quinone oxidoreductase subunit H [Chlorobi bacterium]|nr:NADH-quinone oxidoreductase subunit H [Chlorobiota bacterium]
MEINWSSVIGIVATPVIAFIVGVLYGGAVRKITARVQNRYGPPITQNLFDIIKLYSKKTAIQHGVMQHLGPVFAITASVTSLYFIPVIKDSPYFQNFSFNGDLIFLLYMMVFGSLGMALGAGQTGNPNSAIGVSRGLSQMVGYEIPFVLALVAIMIQFKTTSLNELLAVQDHFTNWIIFQSPLAFVAGILAFLGMMHYAPFDVVIAPAEIASGPPSEFGGKYLGLMMTSGSIFAFVKLVLFVDIFLGGASDFITLIIKTFLLYMIPVLTGIVSPRFRTEQSILFFWKWPTFIGILAIIVVVLNG